MKNSKKEIITDAAVQIGKVKQAVLDYVHDDADAAASFSVINEIRETTLRIANLDNVSRLFFGFDTLNKRIRATASFERRSENRWHGIVKLHAEIIESAEVTFHFLNLETASSSMFDLLEQCSLATRNETLVSNDH